MTQTKQNLLGIGSSLWPLVKNGFELTLRKVDIAKYRCGDLAVFDGKHIQVCHRVLKIKDERGLRWFFMKGDGKLQADGWIPAYRMQGRVEWINGTSLQRFPLKQLSLLFYWHSRFQWACYEALFLSRWGVRARDVRESVAGPRPVFSGMFGFIFSPWTLLNR